MFDFEKITLYVPRWLLDHIEYLNKYHPRISYEDLIVLLLDLGSRSLIPSYTDLQFLYDEESGGDK